MQPHCGNVPVKHNLNFQQSGLDFRQCDLNFQRVGEMFVRFCDTKCSKWVYLAFIYHYFILMILSK